MLSLLFSVLASAAWQPLPPTGSTSLHSLHALGDTLLACGAGGCARTVDGGLQWTYDPSSFAKLLDLDPVISRDTFLNAGVDTLRISADRGQTWKAWGEGIGTNQEVSGLDLSAGVAILSTNRYNHYRGLEVETDTCSWYVRSSGDAQWKSLETSQDGYCQDIAIGANHRLFRTVEGTRVINGSSQSTEVVQQSDNLGASWADLFVGAVLGKASDGSLAAVFSDSSRTSLDSGKTWNPVSARLTSTGFLDGSALANGVWTNLRTGQSRTFNLDSIGTVRTWARTGKRLWAYGNYGLFSSLDSGATWTRADQNIPLGYTTSLAVSNGNTYAILQTGKAQKLVRSRDNGTSWTPLAPWTRGIKRLSSYDAGLAVAHGNGTYIVTDSDISDIPQSTMPTYTSFLGSRAVGIDDASVYSFSASGWTATTAYTMPSNLQVMEMATGSNGEFLRANDDAGHTMRLAYLPDGATNASVVPLDVYVKGITPSLRGVWVASASGLYRCTDALECHAQFPTGTDSLWSWSPVNVQGPFVLASGMPLSTNLVYDYSRPRLFASADSGKTWTNFEMPFLAANAAVTPSGILAATYGAGLWFLPSDTYRVAVSPRSASLRPGRPVLSARGQILSISNLAGPASLQVVDLSGKIVLSNKLASTQGTVQVALPAGISGPTIASIRTAAGISTYSWIAWPR